MAIKHHILCSNSRRYVAILLAALFCFWGLNGDLKAAESIRPQAINIYAGPDQTICANDVLDLSTLGAYITGDVTDGTWFSTNNSGIFTPCNSTSCTFSIAQTYIPGPIDIALGSVDLMLVSYDPDGNGPLLQQIDFVHITLQSQPPMACVSNINVTLGNDCTQEVLPQMLVTNATMPYDNYIITLTDENGVLIPDNILRSEHLGTLVYFIVGHDCGTNTCDGYINVQDKTPPILQCHNHNLVCTQSSDPIDVGLPIPNTATAIPTGPHSFIVSNFDACTDVTLTYQDVNTNMNCNSGLLTRINRTWLATDEFGNSASCFEVLNIAALPIDSVGLPINYDGISHPVLECGGNWPTLPNGHPHPDFTGYPLANGCSNIDYAYLDSEFDLCGSGIKILRKWTIIEECTSEILEYNQIIKVVDTSPPVFQCPSEIVLSTSPYDCATGDELLPPLSNIVDCSNTTTSITLKAVPSNIDFSGFITQVNGLFHVNNLPQGNYTITFRVTDECNNSSSCTRALSVIDDKSPFPICDAFTKVSIGTDGTGRVYAETIDDGSLDNCGIAGFKVAKMTDICGNQAQVFGPFVSFCCTEVGDTIQVALRVTDLFGNNNTCMANVIVEDKIAPHIYCPSNITISCLYDIDYDSLDDFGIIAPSASAIHPIIIDGQTLGYDGYYTDNCNGVVVDTFTENLHCSQGQIIRTFKVTDYFGNMASCQQIVTVVNFNSFDIDDIVFPPNVDIDGCGVEQADTSLTGSPIFTNIGCAQVNAAFDDQIYANVDGVCVKILRLWTVIDWCQYDEITGAGIFQKAQIIKMTNYVAPTILSACKDTVFCNYNQSCGKDLFQYILQGEDDCTADSLLVWTWKIDLFGDNTIDTVGHGPIVAAYLPLGNHLLSYVVKDKCGNTSQCEMTINTVDCKKPTPYCYNSITTVVMPSTGAISVSAEQFNLGSFDNCTASEDLIFSFSTNVLDTTKTIHCSDLVDGISQEFVLNMWVTDESGNQDNCFVHLNVQDNGNICPDMGNNGSITGIINTENGLPVKLAKIKIQSFDPIHSDTVSTNAAGSFIKDSLVTNHLYVVKPSKLDKADKGLSTLDLVKIQRHLLGITKFTSPYKVLASDADGNNKINVSDLVIFRKIILGQRDSFPNGLKPWRFVDKHFVFQDSLSPWICPDSILIMSLDGEVPPSDFVGIKRGDVNNSYEFKAEEGSGENRNDNRISLGVTKMENGDYVLSSNEDIHLFGFQLELAECTDEVEFVNSTFQPDVYQEQMDNNATRIIFYNAKGIHVPKDQILFKSKCVIQLSDGFQNEFYTEDDLINLPELVFNEHIGNKFIEDDFPAQVEYRDGEIHIFVADLESNSNMKSSLYNNMGQLISHHQLVSGENQIPGKSFPFGIYILQLNHDGRMKSYKIPFGSK